MALSLDQSAHHVTSVIVLPTFNEADNIETFLRAVRTATPTTDVLVVDDASLDGTGRIAEMVSGELGRIQVLHRSGRSGLGSAYRDGISQVLASKQYDVIITMDADMSHDPTEIPTFIRLINDGAHLVIGSRYVSGGATTDWPLRRRILSRWGNLYTRLILGLPTHDCTSGFRAYTSEALTAIAPATTDADGYAFLTELVARTTALGCNIVETPITFRDRTLGESKMSARIITESMWLVTRWGIARALGTSDKTRFVPSDLAQRQAAKSTVSTVRETQTPDAELIA